MQMFLPLLPICTIFYSTVFIIDILVAFVLLLMSSINLKMHISLMKILFSKNKNKLKNKSHIQRGRYAEKIR